MEKERLMEMSKEMCKHTLPEIAEMEKNGTLPFSGEDLAELETHGRLKAVEIAQMLDIDPSWVEMWILGLSLLSDKSLGKEHKKIRAEFVAPMHRLMGYQSKKLRALNNTLAKMKASGFTPTKAVMSELMKQAGVGEFRPTGRRDAMALQCIALAKVPAPWLDELVANRYILFDGKMIVPTWTATEHLKQYTRAYPEAVERGEKVQREAKSKKQ